MQPLALSRAARESYQSVLAAPHLRGGALMEALEAAGQRHGIEPFRTCLAMFSRTARSEVLARQVLEAIEQHRAGMERRLERDPGFGVAAADFLDAETGAGWDHGHSPAGEQPAEAGATETLDDRMTAELRRRGRNGRPLSLVLLEPVSSLEGDAAALAAAAVRGAARDVDRTARVLPDGIVVLLPCTSIEDGAAAALRFLGLAARASGGPWCGGVAAAPGHRDDPAALAEAAREALARARRDGPNRVALARKERRRGPRRAVADFLSARLDNGSRTLEVEVLDLSVSGALVRVEQPVAAGDRVTLAIVETTARARRASARARVVRTTPDTGRQDPRWTLGLAFEPAPGLLSAVSGILSGLVAIGPGVASG